MINCKDCRYWVEVKDLYMDGQCRINPPVHHSVGGNNIGKWPATGPLGSCAQGLQKEDVQTPKKEDDPRFRILKDMPVAHESNPLPRTKPIYTTEQINKMQRVVNVAITFQRLHDGECGGLSESDLEVQLDEAHDDLLERVREYQRQNG